MRSLILLIAIFVSIQVQAAPIGLTSGVFCPSLQSLKQLFVKLDSTEDGERQKLSDFNCQRLKTKIPIGADRVPTYQTITNKGKVYHVYRFDLLDYPLSLYGYTDIPPKSTGWDI